INADVNGNLIYTDKDVLSAGPINTHGNNLELSAGAMLMLSGNLDAGSGTVVLTTTGGSISQFGSSTLTASNLLLQSSGGATLNQPTNNVGTIAANVSGPLAYSDADTLTVGSVGGVSGISSHGSNVTLDTGGALTLVNGINAGSGAITFTSAGVNQTGGALVADSLTLGGSGAFALAQSGNDIGALAADITGSLNYHDASALTVGVGSTGVFTHGGGINIETQNGSLTLSQPVDAAVIPNVRPNPDTATAGNVTLSTLTSGNINIDADVTGNTVTINSAAGVRQNATIYSSAGATATINGDYWQNFTSAGNVQGITLVPTATNPHPTLILSAGGTFTVGQSGVLTASNLLLYGYNGSPTFELTNPGNSFGTVAAGNSLFGLSGTPNIHLAMSGGIVIGDVLSHDYGISASGITTGGGNVTLTAGAGGLNGGITLSRGINTTGSTGTVTLVNDAPGNVIQTASGAIITQTLDLNGQGSFLLSAADNNLSTLNANITGAALSYRELNEVNIGNVNVSNNGSVSVDLQAPNSTLAVTGHITATSTGNVAPATVNIYSANGVTINGAINVTGGGNGVGDNAGVYISTTNGPITQNAAITAADNGGSTLSTSAPHSATVMMNARSQCITSLGICVIPNAGQVTSGPINVTSTHGRAVADIFGQRGVNVANAITVTGETAPMLQLSGNLVDNSDPKNPKLVSSANVTVNGALTMTTTGNNAAPSNTVGQDVKSGVIITGSTLAINRNIITTGTTTPDGISMTAGGNVTIASSTVATDSKTGISIALSGNGTLKTTGSGIIRALNPNTADNLGQLTLTAPKNEGTINVNTNVGTIQAVLGGHDIKINNGAHTGSLLATTLGFIKDDDKNPVDLPIGNFELWTGGELQLASVNDYLINNG
ncbi:MAG: beta strand repeat-containing protein, partial [Burkholderiales bacterium]